MTFRKNVIVVTVIVAFLMVVAYLAHIPREIMVYSGAFLIGAGVLFLAAEDVARKYFEAKEKITWQYGLGLVFVVVAVAVYVWALESVENLEFFLRLGLAAFFGIVGGWWFYNKYKKSIRTPEENKQDRWERIRAKVFKAKTKESATKTLYANLRYYLVSDSFNNNLDFHRPLARYNDIDLTYDQLLVVKDVSAVEPLKSRAAAYINNLVGSLTFATIEGGEE